MAPVRSAVLAAATVLLAFSASAASPANVLDLTLTFNSSAGTVTVPGAGSGIPSSLANQTVLSPPSYALIRETNASVAALVFSQEVPHSLVYNQSSGIVSLRLRQNLTGSQAFLVFTRGSAQTVENRLPGVAARRFLDLPTPSFAFPSAARTVVLLLSYPDIAFAAPLTVSSGFAVLEIASTRGAVNGTVLLNISRIRP